jgi:hypothetical protein
MFTIIIYHLEIAPKPYEMGERDKLTEEAAPRIIAV